MSQHPQNQMFVKNADLGYLGNPQVKRDGVQQKFTEEEVSEYLKCMKDPCYFARTYVKVISLDKGLIPFTPYPYQDRMFKHFNDNRFSIVLACRQSGKSISSVIYLLWFALFSPDKTIAILANKAATAREMLARVTLALENLPFFLQPGCRALNKGSIEFSNNSRIIAAATSGSSIRGLSVNLLFMDEFAFVENATTFYTSTYPVVSSGRTSRVIITSTANGVGNQFHKIWEGAVQSTNEYKPFRVDWWDVPGRDENWKKQTVANTSELQFEQEFGNSFHGTGNTLINAETLLSLKAEAPVYTQNGVRVYEKPIADHNYVMVVDVAKGRNQDYSAFSVIDVSCKPFRQVATFRDALISPLIFPDTIYKYAKTYNDAYVIVENNDQGSVVCNGLYYDLEYPNMFVESTTTNGGIGLATTKKTKRIGCSNLKDLVESKKLLVVDTDTIQELSTFEAVGSSYEAAEGNHDDTVMPLVLFGWFAATDLFVQMSSIDVRDMLYADRLKVIEDDVTPVGNLGNLEPPEKKEGAEVDGEGNVWYEAAIPRY
jgi:hypothetical protein